MECPYCKADNRDGVRYCSNCGKLLEPTATAGPNSVADAPASSRSLTPGARLQGGRYIIKKILGQGGMGTALLATDIRLDSKLVVIKELLSDSTNIQNDVRNFRGEVAMLAHIDHPLVPNVTDHFQEGLRYFMVQEYVEGENLEEYMERTNQPMRERDVLMHASNVLDILDYLSLQTPPIVHRDIKPANIIIGSKDKRAHLVDFGIARADIARNAQRKQTTPLGTPGYAPPEQYQGKADPRSDLYALAATLHYLLTNRDPRNHPPFIYPPVRTLNPRLSKEIEYILIHALTNDIQQRYQSAAKMKQDIDDILCNQFGITSSLTPYTLGASGTMGMGAVISAIPTSAPDPLNFSTQVVTPQQGSSVQKLPTPPLLIPPTPAQPTRRRNRSLYLLLLLLLLVLLIGGSLFTYLRGGLGGSNNGIGVTKVGNEYIGISDGSFVFDTGAADTQTLQQAAALIKQHNGNTDNAVALLNQAIGQASNDAQAHIYLEDQRVLASGSPYVTIVVATMLSGDPGTVQTGRDDLQGAYIAQKEYNDGAKLHGGVQVRLLIASSGGQATNAPQVAQQIVQLAQSDKTFVGVMGWPYSGQTLDTIKILGGANIPVVSQTASSDELDGISHYFFRVAPSNAQESVVEAQYAEQVLHVHRIALFMDSNNTYSQNLAQDFEAQFQKSGNQIIATEHYTVGNAATILPTLQDALSKQPDLIFFSGYANDAGTLLTDMPPGNLPILGGDALYELGGYPSSARANFSRLHFTAFSYPDEWDVQGLTARKPGFFAEYIAAFDPNQLHQGSPYGFTRADNDAMLSYDATVALLNGANIALTQTGQKTITPQAVQQGLTHINGSNAFQGVSGQVAFGTNGDPVDKSLVILYVDPTGHIKMEPKVVGRFLL